MDWHLLQSIVVYIGDQDGVRGIADSLGCSRCRCSNCAQVKAAAAYV